jgi:hypothetical protein
LSQSLPSFGHRGAVPGQRAAGGSARLPARRGRARLALVTWNQVVLSGIAVLVASVLLGRGARTASAASLERRCRWAIRLALGYGAVLLVAVLVPLARFAWASWVDTGSSVEERTLLLGACLASAMNLVLGFLIFGMAPTLVAFMLARRFEKAKA